MAEPVWHPSEAFIRETRLYRWMKSLGFEDYDTFYAASVRDVAWFWGEAEKALGIAWMKPYERVLDLRRGPMWPEWFVGGKLNAAYDALGKWLKDPLVRDRPALIWEGEEGQTKRVSYAELAARVDRVAQGLVRLGLQPGDRVALYLPMVPEAVVALLAAAKIGAVTVPMFSGYGAEAVWTRLESARPKILITADGFFRRGRPVAMKEEADRAVERAPYVERVIVVRRAGREGLLQPGRDVEWEALETGTPPYAPAANETFRPLDSAHPLLIIYTSGTTGRPKGALHTHGGFPLKSAFDAGFGMDVRPGDVMLWVTDMGWMMGPFLIFATLVNAATMVLYDGTPDHPAPDRLWDLVARHRVTHLGVSPTLIRALMPHGEAYPGRHDLSSLRVIGSTGEPWNPEPWKWLFEKVGKSRIPIFNYSGGTEISGGILGNVLIKPIAPITFNAALPGMAADVYDPDGKPVRGTVGELVLKAPWVGQTRGFWGEPERYEETYWKRWPGIWVHGDWVILDEDGFWTITGRSDDTLNVAGKRLGPAEIESILTAHPAIKESAVIGVPDDVKGEVPVAFVVLKPGREWTSDLRAEILHWVAERLGKALRPKAVYCVDDLPKTRNAKILRRAIRAAYLGQDPGDLSSLENPEAVDAIRKLAAGDNSDLI
ncbi:MAG: Acetoacetyl-CoA synthetase [leucine] [Hydrogenibacillus schlegelii]|uniref:acetate--CoA ligase n=1 Tax=Hydrogenibacillus schlegelii TaxID=1484 RepID=A0A2T5GE36_HYDSH|nr:AMP-binding protein [Hydrogenibacillus schlegelii]PTQ54447.1 MAG: Acetoacetyl-CoA synthetase [leucine] [Hydrogenibacillus schlegelii]